MKSLATVTSTALLLSLAAAPAMASKPVRPADSSVKKEGDTPKGIEVAQGKAADNAGQAMAATRRRATATAMVMISMTMTTALSDV